MITLEPGTLFTVAQYPYTTFESGTDIAYSRKYRDALPAQPGTPWAFPHAAIIAARELQFARPVPAFNLSFGDVVNIPEYGLYSVQRDHNRNVKFVAVDCHGPTWHDGSCKHQQDETGS